MNIVALEDCMTSDGFPFTSKITDNFDDNIFHSHMFYEMFYIIEGSISHSLNGETEMLTAGDMFFLDLNDVHTFFRESGNTCKHRDIIIRKDFFEDCLRFIGENFCNDYKENKLPKCLKIDDDDIKRLESQILNVNLTSHINSNFFYPRIRMLCVSLLNYLLNKQEKEESRLYPVWIEELLSRFHINQYACEGLTSILEPFHFDQAYMCRAFKKYVGCTMTDYLNDIRIRHAIYLLQYSNETVSSIAYTIGFASPSYFNSIFKKCFNMTPKMFRRQHLYQIDKQNNNSRKTIDCD